MTSFLPDNIKRAAKRNSSFRRVARTGPQLQVTVMCLQPGEDIGEEIHAFDQIFVVVQGRGEITVDGTRSELAKNDLVIVPAGAHHDVRAGRERPLRLISISGRAQYPDGIVHETKADAMAAEAESEAVGRQPAGL